MNNKKSRFEDLQEEICSLQDDKEALEESVIHPPDDWEMSYDAPEDQDHQNWEYWGSDSSGCALWKRRKPSPLAQIAPYYEDEIDWVFTPSHINSWNSDKLIV